MIPSRLNPQVALCSEGEYKHSYYKLLKIEELSNLTSLLAQELTPLPRSPLFADIQLNSFTCLDSGQTSPSPSPTHIKFTLYPEIPRCSQCMLPVISGVFSLFLTKSPPTPFPDILKGIYMPPVILFLE